MNNLEYLNEISKSNRRTSTAAPKTNPALIKVIVGGVVALVLVLIVGIIAGSGGTKSSELTQQLFLRTNNLSHSLSTYNPYVKSSKLRSLGISLSGALTGASAQLSGYMTGANLSTTQFPEEIAASESEHIGTFDTTLNNAKLNGILDRIYATQVQLQVSLLLALISQSTERTKDPDLLTILDNYSSNLSIIEQSFESYSNPSD